MNEDALTKWFLSLSEEAKLDTLKDSLKQDRFEEFTVLTKVLLNTSIQDGGIATDKIKAVVRKFLDEGEGGGFYEKV